MQRCAFEQGRLHNELSVCISASGGVVLGRNLAPNHSLSEHFVCHAGHGNVRAAFSTDGHGSAALCILGFTAASWP